MHGTNTNLWFYMASAAFASAKAPSFVLFPMPNPREPRIQLIHETLTTNETARVNKYSAIDTRCLG